MNNILDSSTSSSSDDEYIFIRRRKVYKRRENYLETLDDIEFFHRFRITKHTFNILLDRIKDEVKSATTR